MKQPMLAPASRMPPAQAEVLYDALENTPADGLKRVPETSWPGEDWDDDALVSTTVEIERGMHGKRTQTHRQAFAAY